MQKIVIATTECECYYLSPAALLRLARDLPSALNKYETSHLEDLLISSPIEDLEDGFQHVPDQPGKLFHGKFTYFFEEDDEAIRALPAFVRLIEEMGNAAAVDIDGKPFSTEDFPLKIVEIPDDVRWHICRPEFGSEWVAENHRTWS